MQLEIKVVIDPLNAKQFYLYAGKNKETGEETKIEFDVSGSQIIVDQTHSTKRQFIPLDTRSGKINFRQKKLLDIHLFIDGSVIEVFINDKDAFTTRIFPSDVESNEVELCAENGNIKVVYAGIWNMKESPVKNDF